MKALLILILLMPVIKVTQAQERNNNTAIDLNGKKLTLQKVSLAMYKSISSKPFNRRIKDTSIIKRVGVLRFKLPNGKEVTFKDINSKHEADNKTFLFKGILNNRFYIILGKYYDTGEYLLVNKYDGNTTSLWGDPIISPDGTHLAAFSSALGYDMMPNGVQMFTIDHNKLVPDWEYKIEDWEPEALRWVNTNSLIITKHIPADLSKTNHEVKEYIKITF